jgi:hypothetical protein
LGRIATELDQRGIAVFSMFTIHFDIAFFPNRIRMTEDKSNQTVDRAASQPFSSEHRLIPDKNGAARFLHDAMRAAVKGDVLSYGPLLTRKFSRGRTHKMTATKFDSF